MSLVFILLSRKRGLVNIGSTMVPSRRCLLFSGTVIAHILLEKYMLYALNVCGT